MVIILKKTETKLAFQIFLFIFVCKFLHTSQLMKKGIFYEKYFHRVHSTPY